MPVTEKEFIIVSSLGNGCAGERKEDRRSQH